MKTFILFFLVTLRLCANTLVTENDPSTLVEGLVSVITGDLYLAEEDIVIEGAEPLHIRRHYMTKGFGVTFFTHLLAGYHPVLPATLAIQEPNGSVLHFYYTPPKKQKKNNPIVFEQLAPHSMLGASNTARGKISAQTNLKNYRAHLSEKSKCIVLDCPDGTTRTYRRLHHQEDYRTIKIYGNKFREYLPLQFALESETLPNGNKIRYHWDGNNTLTSIRTTNPSGNKTYAQATIHYQNHATHQDLDVNTSDRRCLQYRSKPFACKQKTSGVLTRVTSPEYPEESFEYTKKEDLPFLTEVSLPQGRRYFIEHDHRYRVTELRAPLGLYGFPVVTHSFRYFPENQRRTDVTDSEGATTRYFWSEEMRLIRIERYTKTGDIYNSERFGWGRNATAEAGNLQFRTLFDSDHTPLFSRSFRYDQKGNVLEETFWGNLEVSSDGTPKKGERYQKRFKYDDRNNVVFEEEDNGKSSTYTYLAQTNLCTAHLTYDANKIVKRRFLTYTDDNILTREVEDNGSSKEPPDLSSVTVRKIKEIKLMEQGPYLNMPETVEEKYGDGSTERLLKRTTFTYTTGGAIAAQAVCDADGAHRYTLTTEYDTKGRPLKESNALGQTAISEYDEVGNKTFFQDFSRNTLRMEYNLLNHVTRVNEHDLRHTEHQYDKRGNRLSTTDFRGHTTHFVYDGYDRLLETRLPTGECLKKRYDGAGREISTTDACGNTTTKKYNAYGKPLEILHPDGTKELFTYNLDGTLKTHTDQNGTQTHYTHDCFGRVTSKTIQEHKETFTYDAFNLLSKTDAEGNTTFYTYDGAGRKIAESLDTQRTEYRYDALGRVSEVGQGDLVIVKEYDLLNRVLSEKKQSKEGSLLAQEEYAYDAAGDQTTVVRYPDNQKAVECSTYDRFHRLICKVDALGHETIIAHRDVDLKKFITDPLGNYTTETHDSKERLISCAKKNKKGTLLSLEEYSYDGNDNLIKQNSSIYTAAVLARRVTTLWQYDSMNRLITLTEASGTDEEKTTTHAYTPKGLLAQKTKPDGTTISHTYDALDRCIETRSSDGTIHYTFYYNAIGQLLSSKDEITGLTTQKHWNGNGQLLHELLGNGLSLTSTYDEQGRRLSLTLPDNSWIAYTYDPLYLRSVTRRTEHASYTHHFTHYDLAENLQREELIHPLATLTYQIDPLSRKWAINCPHYAQHVLAFDKVGNILSMQFPEERVDYTYDDLYQLTHETGLFTHTYAYDSHFNRISQDDTTYHINALNQNSLLHYDGNGNPLSHGAQRMHYDALDRLLSIEDSQQKLVFTYDADHRRLSKHLYTSENGQWTLQKQLYFLYDGKNEIGSLNEQGAFQELRILGRTPHAEIGSALALEIKGTLYAPIHDLQGNLCTLVPIHAPYETERYRFSAFGEEQAPAPTSPWRFSSKRTDESSLVYYGRRYYSPHLGRWLTPDPLGLSAGINLYAFVSNDPLIRLDDYGLLDYGQHYTSWKDQQEAHRRFYTAGIHEFWSQVVGIGRFFSSTPHYLERGLNYCTFSNTSVFDGWEQKHNKFFNSAESWIQRVFPTDQSHPDYSTYRIGWFVSSLMLPVPGKGIINGARGITKFGTAAWEGKRVIDGLRKPFPKRNILFGQSSVGNRFSHGSFKRKSIYEVAKALKEGKMSPDQLPIDYVIRNGQMVTINNRSLLVFKKVNLEPTIMRNRTGDPFYENLLTQHLENCTPSEVIRVRGDAPNASWVGP